MATKTKGEIVTRAFRWIRISGLTTTPQPNEVQDAIEVLEGMMAELDSRNICTSYNFEDVPDTGTESGIDNEFWLAASYGLGTRIAPDYGKALTQDQLKQSAAAMSNWSASTSVTRQLQAPRRQPRGSGNTLRAPNWYRYNRAGSSAPISCETEQITRNAINDYTYSFVNYLADGETLTTYTFEASTSLTIVSESMSSPIWSYKLSCANNSSSHEAVQLTVNTSNGRRETFTINFNVTGVEITN